MTGYREVGSEFPIYDREGTYDLTEELSHRAAGLRTPRYTYYLRCGRDALGYIADDILHRGKGAYIDTTRPRAVFMPALSCDSMVRPFMIRRGGFEIRYYRSDAGLRTDIDYLRNAIGDLKEPVVLVMNHFGIADTADTIAAVRACAPDAVIIEDITHILFSQDRYLNDESQADYHIGSIRKWLGIPDGAVVISKEQMGTVPGTGDTAFSDLRYEALNAKKEYLKSGEPDADLKRTFRSLFADAEDSLDDGKVPYAISDKALDILSHIDIDEIRRRRCDNYRALKKALMNLPERGVYYDLAYDPDEIIDCPFMLPVVMDIERIRRNSHSAAGRSITRDWFESKLASAGVYAPVLWPIDAAAATVSVEARHFADNMLAFYIDQRYDTDDMNYVAAVFGDEIKRYSARI